MCDHVTPPRLGSRPGASFRPSPCRCRAGTSRAP
jgi:hypothetical protein